MMSNLCDNCSINHNQAHLATDEVSQPDYTDGTTQINSMLNTSNLLLESSRQLKNTFLVLDRLFIGSMIISLIILTTTLLMK